jgi:hypothetical protein
MADRFVATIPISLVRHGRGFWCSDLGATLFFYPLPPEIGTASGRLFFAQCGCRTGILDCQPHRLGRPRLIRARA